MHALRLAAASPILLGCSPDARCTGGEMGSSVVRSGPVQGSLTLTETSAPVRLQLRAIWAGGPVLFPADFGSYSRQSTVSATVQYSDGLSGSNVEMPRIRVGYGMGTAETSRFSTGSFAVSTELFGCPSGDSVVCCPSGGPDCSHALTLTFERLDGAPFPAVTLDWTSNASVTVSDCPPGAPNATLTLELLEP